MFTAPCAGVYLITFSFRSANEHGEVTEALLYTNGQMLPETYHDTYYYGGSGQVVSTGGRSVYQRLEAGDTINLHAGHLSGYIYRILFCIQFINN